jgi:FKBP-type peptidyl-prolyl cis-trans isomerase
MKKILLGAGAAVLLSLAFTACDKNKSCEGNKCLADSTSTAYGTMAGNIILGDYTQFANTPDSPDKESLLKGVKLVFSSKADKGTLIGMQMAIQMLSEIEHIDAQGVKMDRAKVLSAFTKAFGSDSINPAEIAASSENFQRLMNAAMEAAKETPAEKAATEADATSPSAQNVAAADVFMDMTKTENPNVMTTESGLSYEIKEPGEGAHPTATSTVTVNYTGRLIDGKVFDSSEGRGPASFPVNGVIAGFAEGLQLLGKGGKATLYIPGNLAYGEQGAPQAGIGPNEMLIFDVELIDFK